MQTWRLRSNKSHPSDPTDKFSLDIEQQTFDGRWDAAPRDNARADQRRRG